MFYIGIDSGEKNGIALMTDRTQLIDLASIDYYKYGVNGLVDRAENMFMTHQIPTYWNDTVIICVEKLGNYIRSNDNHALNMAIGKCIQKANDAIREFERAGYTVIGVNPRSGRGSWTKWKKPYFNKFFSWDKQSNQDQRDAACMAERGRQIHVTSLFNQGNQKGGLNVKSESKERREKRKQVREERQASTDEQEIEYRTVRERRQKNRSKSN